jgi:hypothetical protein
MNETKVPPKRVVHEHMERERIDSFWFLLVVLLAFAALIGMSIYKAIKPL